MQVKIGGRICLDARAKPEPTDDLLFHDYYSRTPQIRLTGDATEIPTETATEVLLDGNDVARLVSCAVRHPSLNMRHAVLTAIWNHPDSFRQIFQFGVGAPPAFSEIRKIVTEEFAKSSLKPEFPASKPAGETLLPRMPRPAHLKDRKRQS